MSSNELSDNEVEESNITKIIAAPLQFVKTIFPLYSTGDVSQESQVDSANSEMVGDKLRLKRGRMKKKSTVQDKLIHHNRVAKANHGCQRSVVRYIGSNVPLKPSKRAYYQLFEHSRRTIINSASTFFITNLDHVRQHVDQVKHHVVPTLADIGQLVWDDINVFVNDEDDTSSDEEVNFKDAPSKPAISNEDPNKLSALEDELAKLRAQIAAIVSNRNVPNPAAPSAQIAVVQPTSMLPPPPPPPPPLPIFKNANASAVCMPSIKVVNEENKSSMNDVLKGLSNVKLKNSNICRSPGGTPLKKNDRLEDLSNPADIIAKALREKFQNSNMYRSPDGENSSLSDFSPSPQKNPSRPIPKPRPRPVAQKKILDT
ncbi:mitochondrial fission regulator 2 isoform X1 [Hydra vulgaris]|uniref:mitochondrial fission regulator 2 isoform X1 n=1 Tax=Hydra vulgaris TaxID=6087 RepID=UPI001F5ED2A5|nr:mitochondrial fission regulator 2 [Hydra vulgaris]